MAREDEEFRASDLIGPAGAGSNGEKLVAMLLVHYPPELRAALLKRINPTLDQKVDRESVAKLLGLERIEQCHVRGGDQRESEALVTYAYFDDKDTVLKGAFPYTDVAKGKLTDDKHVSQRKSLQDSAYAAEYRRDNPARPSQTVADPFAMGDMSAEELIALMDAHPDKAEMIKAFEKASHGRNARKTVLEHEVASSTGD